MKEVFYAYEQTKLKKTPAQIRAGIIKGDWKSIDLEQQPPRTTSNAVARHLGWVDGESDCGYKSRI